MQLWVPLLAALLGAIAGGGLKFVIDLIDRHREDEAILVALASEVKAICDLLRMQDYLGDIDNWLTHLAHNSEQNGSIVVEFRSDYFVVYHALTHQLGRLSPSAVAEIVRFYMNCKTIIDCTRPDGVAAQVFDNETFISNLNSLRKILIETLSRGDQIVQLPKKSLSAPWCQ